MRLVAGAVAVAAGLSALGACGGSPAPRAAAPSNGLPVQEPPAAATGVADEPEPGPEPEPAVPERAVPPAAPTMHEYVPAPPTVTVLARGRGKRAPLRYTARAGDPADCQLAMDMTMVTKGVTVAVPTLTMGWTGAITAAEAGELTSRVTVDVIEVAPGGDALAQSVGAATLTQLAPLRDATMETLLTELGVTRRSVVTTQGAINPTMAASMRMSAGAGIVVPQEALGIGGRWQVVRTETIGVMTTSTTTTFDLVARKGAVATLHGTVESVSTMPGGTTAGTSTGTATAAFDGTLCFPSTSTIDATVTVPAPSSMKITLTSGRRAAR